MHCKVINNSGMDLGDLEQHIQGMYKHFDDQIGFSRPPTLFLDSDPSNAPNTLGKTAYYDPQTFEIHVYTDGRHPKDMLRSIAHELIHHQQNLEGRLDVGGYHGEGYYLHNEALKELEQEAMLEGNHYLREYEDTLKTQENQMSLKEWKNKELFENLMGKWGIKTNILNEKKSVPKYNPEKHGEASEGPGPFKVANMKTPDDKDDDILVREEELEEGEHEQPMSGVVSMTGHPSAPVNQRRFLIMRGQKNVPGVEEKEKLEQRYLNYLRRMEIIGPSQKESEELLKMQKKDKMEEELAEAKEVINQLRSDLNEVNLLNSKLLYTNKIFRGKSLTENQKIKVLKAFDKAETVKQAKTIFETLNENLVTKSTKSNIRESLGSASKPAGVAPKRNLNEGIIQEDAMVARFQKLAGIN